MTDYYQERTQQPTAKRLQDAKEEGLIPRSQELTTFVVLFYSAIAIALVAAQVIQAISNIMIMCFSMKNIYQITPDALMFNLKHSIIQIFASLLPLFSGLLICALAAPLLLGGFHFNTNLLSPKLTRLNPIIGLKRTFTLRSLLELFKSLLKFIFIITAALVFLYHYYTNILSLSSLPIHIAIITGTKLLLIAFLVLTFCLSLFAIIDIPYQRWEYLRRLKMSVQEIRDEKRMTEGSPEIKQRIRKQRADIYKNKNTPTEQQEDVYQYLRDQEAAIQSSDMSQQMMIEASKKAHVIIASQSKYAVGLQYKQDSQDIPTVISKGIDNTAEKIRFAGITNQVPIISSDALAKSLYYYARLNQEIPEGLYIAIAKILAYLDQLRKYHQGNLPQPQVPQEFVIPQELQHD